MTPPKIAAITGASSGIGRATAAAFARQNWRVGLIARGAAGLDSIHADITAAGGQACTAIADVRDPEALEQAAAKIEAALGPIDVWINCAGNGVYGRFLDIPAEEFACVTGVTYGGTVNGTRVALRRMLPKNAGVIVNVCSAIAYHGMPLLTSYSGAKAAVRGFTDGIRAELIHDRSRVRVTIVFPPAVNTPFFSHAPTYMTKPPRPAKPVYQPDIIAAAILRAAKNPPREMRVGAITTLFDIGNRLVPALIDRAIGRLGYEGQETDNPAAARLHAPTLFQPSHRAWGAHGVFDDEARGVPVLDWIFQHKAASLAALVAAVLALWWR